MAEDQKTPNLKTWPEERMTRLPAWIYTDPALFEREMEKFFFGKIGRAHV